MIKISPKTPKSRRRMNSKLTNETEIIKNEINENSYGFINYDNESIFAYQKISKLKNLIGIEIISKYEHPNFLKFYELSLVDNFLLLRMDLSNQTFKNYCKSINTNLTDKIIQIYKICKGLVFLHEKNIVHTNINFESLSISSGNELIFSDLNKLHRLLKSENGIEIELSQLNIYTSPNIFIEDDKKYKKSDDVWAFGILMLNILESKYENKILSKDQLVEIYNHKFEKDVIKSYIKKFVEFNLPLDNSKEFVDLALNIFNKDEEKRYKMIDILNHNFFSEIKKIDESFHIIQNESSIRNENIKYCTEFRDQLKLMIAFLNKNFPEKDIEIFFTVVDLYYKCYGLNKYDEILELYSFCCIFLGFLYFENNFDFNLIKLDEFSSLDDTKIQEICFQMIFDLKGIIYTNEPFNHCVYQEDIDLILEDLIMDKNFSYLNFEWKNWEKQFISNRNDETKIPKEGLKIKDIIFL